MFSIKIWPPRSGAHKWTNKKKMAEESGLEDPNAVEEEEDENYYTDDDGVEWWKDDDGYWWYREPGQDDWQPHD